MAAGGGAYATVPSASSNLIHICFKSGDTTKLNGTPVTIIDTDSGATCNKGYTDLAFNQQGIQGIQGPPGIQGLKGDKGDQGDPGESALNTGSLPDALYPGMCPNGGYQLRTREENATTYTTVGICHGAKGDKGDKGDTGATGATGAQGPAGAAGANLSSWEVVTASTPQDTSPYFRTATATCPEGKRAISGGAELTGGFSDLPLIGDFYTGAAIVKSKATGSAAGWTATAYEVHSSYGKNWGLDVYAYCISG